MIKKLVLGAVLGVASFSASANPQVWACQETASIGFNFNGGKWVRTEFILEHVLIKVDGIDSTFKESGDEFEYGIECLDEQPRHGGYVTCRTSYGTTLMINTQTGMGGISSIYGLVSPSDEYRDSVDVSTINCIKIN